MECESSSSMIAEGVERCPFLRNIGEPTLFNFSSFSSFPAVKFPTALRARGPIFEDGPGFDNAFRLFHGKDGVIPLAQKAEDAPTVEAPKMNFNPLAASAATISLSAFGPAGGAFNFDAFMAKQKKQQQAKKKSHQENFEKSDTAKHENHLHEALGSEWLATGKCPIAKSCRAVSGVLPLVAKWLKPPSGANIRCPPAIVAARAALARTAFAKNLRPQPLPMKLLAIGLLGMATNVPLGVWREHTKKFSPSWFVAVHAAVPFIAMLRKAVNMPQHAIAFTIAASILGQVIGSRAERLRLAQRNLDIFPGQVQVQVQQAADSSSPATALKVGPSPAASAAALKFASPKAGAATGFLGNTSDDDEFFDAASEVVDKSSLSQQCAMLAKNAELATKPSSTSRAVTVF